MTLSFFFVLTFRVVGDSSLFTEYYLNSYRLSNQSLIPYFKQCNEILLRNRKYNLINSHMIPFLIAFNSMTLEDGYGAIDVIKLVFGNLLQLQPIPAWMLAVK